MSAAIFMHINNDGEGLGNGIYFIYCISVFLRAKIIVKNEKMFGGSVRIVRRQIYACYR